MTTLMQETAPFVRILLPKIDAAHRRLLRAIDNFAEARMRRAVPHWAKRFFQPYRPELHYMRGPGPRWNAKHDKA